MRCVKAERVENDSDLCDLEIEGGGHSFVAEGVVVHNSSFRVGYSAVRNFVVGTHTARVIDSRMSSGAWPTGHLIQKALDWVEREHIRDRVERWRLAHSDVSSFGVYGEICGYKCSDLHYGRTTSGVRLFGEVTVDGRFLDWDAAIGVLSEMFPDLQEDWLVPALYRGPPDLAVFKELRDRASTFAAWQDTVQISEGVVIRPTTEAISKVTMNRLAAKYKSPLYEERKSLRDKDPTTLPTYVTAYDLLADFVTEERIRHVFQRAEASGMVIEKKRMRDLGRLLYDDIHKESVGEWPAGSETLDEGTLRRWTFDLAGEMISKAIEARGGA